MIIRFPKCSLCGSLDSFKCGNCFGRFCWTCTTVFEYDTCKHVKPHLAIDDGWVDDLPDDAIVYDELARERGL